MSLSLPPHRPTAKALSQPFDVIVIGGGINGSGIARDAAERGMKVLLVEKNDFGAGTTAYSTRLIHGGLRYLENMEVGLVRESLREREVLLKNAPHLVHPLPLGIPVYKGDKRGKFLIKIGMMLYDLLSWDKTLPRHKMLNRDAFLKAFPGIEEKGLVGGAIYYDAQVNLPERICVENVLAAQAHGAVVLNHAKVEQIESVTQANQQSARVRFTDLVTGESLVANSARVVNAGGVWVDELLGKVQAKPADVERKIGGTKGSHLVVRKFPGGPENALYVEAREDGRPFFIIPWQKDYYLIGTTDLPYKGDLDKVVADEDEIAYLKRETRRIFPKAELDILYTYSGVRPLPYAGNKKAGKITRKHIIWDHGVKDGIQGLLSIIGGKLTTYRNLAEETVDLLVKQLKLKVKPCDTRTTPLPGGAGIAKLAQYKKDTVPQASQTYNVPSETVDYLIDVYGSRYREVLELTRENSVWARPLVPGNPAIQAQVIHAVRNEFACSSADVLMRRTGLALREGVGLDAAETTARLIAQELGWTSEQLQADLTQYRQTVLTLNHPVQYASQPAESARS